MFLKLTVLPDLRLMKSNRKKRSKQKQLEITGDDVPVMQINTKWGRNKNLYFEDGASGSESDEEAKFKQFYIQNIPKEEFE